ncbi:unnamed protein product [Prunus armeniaca]
MPRVVSQNKYLISSIIFLFQQVVKLWAKACACVALSIFLIVCIPFLILVLLPFFTSFLWALFLCKILCFFRLCPQFRFLETKIFFNYLSCTATKFIGSRSSTSHFECDYNHKINNNDNELIAKSLEDKQESVDLDPSELPCLYESDFDIEEDHQEINSERRVKEGTTGHIRTYQKEGSWQVVVSKPALSKKREPQSFYDVLSFWKCKEKGQET